MTALHDRPLTGLEHDHETLPPAGGDLTREQALVAVEHLSAHLAAMEHVVYPVAARTLVDGPGLVDRARRDAHRMTIALRRLDRHLTGDGILRRVPLTQLWESVVQDGLAHAEAEHRLLTALDLALGRERAADLASRYQNALLGGPSRPHPHAPVRGLRGRLAFRLLALVDRARDALDGRPAFTSRPTRPVPPPGVWAAYVLGTARDLRH